MMGDGKWVYSMSSMFRVVSIISIVSMFSIISNCRIRILELSIWHLAFGIWYWVLSIGYFPEKQRQMLNAKCYMLPCPRHVPPPTSPTSL